MKNTYFQILLLPALLFIIVLAGCSTQEDKIANHIAKAEQYIQKEEYKAAIIELRNVIQLDPKASDARYQLGLAYLKTGAPQKAFQELRIAGSLDPNNLDAQLKTAEFYFLGKKYEESRDVVDAILEKEPDHLEATLLLAKIELVNSNFDRAEELVNGALQNHPDNAAIYLLQARIFSMSGQGDAEKPLRNALELDPQNISLHQLLVGHYLRHQQIDKAKSQIETMVEKFPDSSETYLLQASVLANSGKREEAIDVLEQIQPRFLQVEQVNFMLAQLYNQEGNSEKAEKQLMDAVQNGQNTVLAQTKLADFYLQNERFAEAQTTVSEILANDSSQPQARLVQAKLLQHEEKYDEALEILEELTTNSPRWGEPYLQKGLIYFAKGQMELSQKNAQQAVQYLKNSYMAHSLLAQHYLRKEESENARKEAKIALALKPNNLKAALVIGLSYIQDKEYEKAYSIFEKMHSLLPENPEITYNLAVVRLQQGKLQEAMELAEKTLAIQPGNHKALMILVNVHLYNKEPEKALARIRSQVDVVPQNLQILKVLGDFLFKQKMFEEAKPVYSKMQSLSPEGLYPYLKRTQIEVLQGNLSSAISNYRDMLVTHPNNRNILMNLAVLLEKVGKVEEAKEKYEQLLSLDASFVPAANNLAWLLAQEQEPDLGRAMQLAMTAQEAYPNNGHINSTLGYIHFLRNSYGLAEQQLRLALESLPDSPTIRFHLALTLDAQGKQEEAISQLKKSLKSSEDFKERAQAENLLQKLQQL